ncbi:MAG: hypothetical protein WHS89_04860 [Acidimicrobiales bacterium]
MRELLVILFWLWLLTSLSVYAYRLYRRLTRGRQPGAPPDRDVAAAIDPERSGSALPPLLSASSRPPAPVPGADHTRAEPPATPETPPAARQPGPAAPTSTPPSGRAGVFPASLDTSVPMTAGPGPGGTSVAEAVRGIRMPCGLAPLVGSSTALDPNHVVFSTTETTPEVVGTALADELERLGFTIRSVATNQAVATKPGAQVTVTVHTDLRAFPTAPPGSVVVTLAT